MGLFNKIRLHDFCLVFSLQSGVVITLMIGLTIILTILFTIITSFMTDGMPDNIIGFLVVMGHIIIMLIGFLFAFLGAYKESSILMLLGAIFVFIGFIIYLIATIFSFLGDDLKEWGCIYKRCSDHLWIQESHWRDFGDKSGSGGNTAALVLRPKFTTISFFEIQSRTPFLVDRKNKKVIIKRVRGGRVDDVMSIPPITLQFESDRHCKDRGRCDRSIRSDFQYYPTPSIDSLHWLPPSPKPTIVLTEKTSNFKEENITTTTENKTEPVRSTHISNRRNQPDRWRLLQNYENMDREYYQYEGYQNEEDEDEIEKKGGSNASSESGDSGGSGIPLLFISFILIFLYSFFLIYSTIVYIAFSNELKDSKKSRY